MIGLIGTKVGMTQLFDDRGNLVPVTAIRIEPNVVVGRRTLETHGYDATILGSGAVKASRMRKPVAGQFPSGTEPRRVLKEFRDFDFEVEIGGTLGVEALENVGHVDVQGITKGKGYQGVMRRHGFAGGNKTHGSKFHRANGSTGMAAAPSKVMKGTRMPGRMGAELFTAQNLRIVRLDAEHQVLLVRGAVPGRRDSVLFIREAKKK